MRTSWRYIGGLGIAGEEGCRVYLALNKPGTFFFSDCKERLDCTGYEAYCYQIYGINRYRTLFI